MHSPVSRSRTRASLFVSLALLLSGPRPEPVHAQSEHALADGATQLGVIVKDRPQLGAILRGREELRQWLVTELDRQSPSPLWDPREPVSGRTAEHEYPSPGGTAPAGTAVIRVSSRASGWDQLAGLVFELHNVQRSGRFVEIYRAAVRGEIDKAEYVRQSLEQEFGALRATRDFLEQYFGRAPEGVREGSPLFHDIMETGDTLEAHLDKHDGNRNSLTAHFEQLYEREVLPESRRIGGRSQ